MPKGTSQAEAMLKGDLYNSFSAEIDQFCLCLLLNGKNLSLNERSYLKKQFNFV